MTAVAATGSTSTTSGSSGGGIGSLTANDFINLLVAQLKNQDPNSPSDPQALATEFANLAEVNGIQGLQADVSSIKAGASAAQLAQAAGMVGKTVAVSGNSFTVPSSGAATGAFSLPAASAATNVTIYNSSGDTVGTLKLGAMPAGTDSFSWSGGTAGQTYTFAVGATDQSGGAITPTTYATGTVTAVDLSGGTPALTVSGQSSSTPLSSIDSIIGA